MKRNTKRGLAVAAALAVLGLVLSTAALAMAGFDFARLSVPSGGEWEARDSAFDPAEVSRIVVETSLDSVELLPSADGQIHLHWFSGGGTVYDTAVTGGELSVRQRREEIQRLPGWFQFNLNGDQGKTLSLSVPKGFDGDILLELDLGTAEIADGVEIDGAIDAALDLGGFSAGELTARSVTVQCDAGSVAGRGWQVKQYVFLTASMGHVNLEDSAVGSTISCSADLGDIALSGVSAQEAMFRSGAGSIGFYELAADNIQAESDLGDIDGSILGKEADYSIEAGTDLGECSLTNRQGPGDKALRLSCDAGDIRVRFLPEP